MAAAYLYLRRVSERTNVGAACAATERVLSLSLPIARSRSHCRSLTPLAECASAFRTLCNERVCPVQSQTNSRSRVNVQQIQHEGGGEEEQEKQQQNKN